MSQSPEHIFPRTQLLSTTYLCLHKSGHVSEVVTTQCTYTYRLTAETSVHFSHYHCDIEDRIASRKRVHRSGEWNDLRSPSTRAAINMFANFHRRSNCNYSSEHNFTASQACSIIYLSLARDFLHRVCNCDNFDCYRNLFSFLFRSTKAFLEFFLSFSLNRVLSSLLFR